MPRKSNYRPVAECAYVRRVVFMTGPRHLRCGLLTTLVLVTTSMKGELPPAISSHEPVHSLSPEIVKAVAQKLPKYDPKAAAKSVPEEPVSNDAYESAGVLYLPKVTVRKDRLSAPDDFAFLTPKGRMELAFKSFPGLRIGNFFGLNEGKEAIPVRADNGYAATRQAEEREVERKQSLKETVDRTHTDDGPESRRVDRLLKEALARTNMDWVGQGKP